MKARSFTIICLIFLTLLTAVSCKPAKSSAEETNPGAVFSLLSENGEPLYTVIRPENSDDKTTKQAVSVCQALSKVTGKEFTIETDYVKRNSTEDLSLRAEILIGDTNRAETASVKARLGELQYAITQEGNKLVIAANDVFAQEAAVDAFLALIGDTQNSAGTIPLSGFGTFDYTFTIEADPSRVIQTVYETEDVVVADVVADSAFGVDPTGEKDSTMGIQRALSEVSALGGGTVWLPAGKYKLTSGISIPTYCTLRGDWQDPDTGSDYGTVLLAYVKENNDPLITIGGSAGAYGLTVYYPEQSLDDVKEYGFTFHVTGVGKDYMLSTIKNCTILNGYRGFSASNLAGDSAHELFSVDTLKGTVLSVGMEAYDSADVDTMRNITLSNKYWSEIGGGFAKPDSAALDAYTRENVTGLLLGDLEWIQFTNISLSQMKTGVEITYGHRIQFAGCFYALSIRDCTTGMKIDQLDERWGVEITDSEIEGSLCSIRNSTNGIVKMTNVRLTGRTSGSSSRFVSAEAETGIALPQGMPYQKPANRIYPVRADNTGKTDISQILQAYLDEAGKEGGVVYLAAGNYRIEQPVTVPAGVELRGCGSVASRGENGYSAGTILLCYYGIGAEPEADAALITLSGENAGVSGLRIVYPTNGPTAPWKTTSYAIRGTAKGVYCVNCAVVCGSHGIDFSGCDAHYVYRFISFVYENAVKAGGKGGVIYGCLQNATVMSRNGISADKVGWTAENNLMNEAFSVTQKNTTLIKFDGAEGETVINCFAYGVKTLLDITGGKTQAVNLGSDNLGGVMLIFTGGDSTICNIMRYNGTAYRSRQDAVVRLFTRLAIGNTNEGNVNG